MGPFPVNLNSMPAYGSDSDDSDHCGSPSQQTPLALSWRNDRTETHSDWSICVIKLEKGEEIGREMYHVHKNILSTGSRSSEYFARMFQTGMKEQGETSCTLELHPLQASVMPNVLDYLYAPSDDEGANLLGISTSTATGLYSLGDYFQIADLRRRVRAFYKADVQLHSLKLYYTQAHTLRTQKVMEHVQQVTAMNLVEVATAPRNNAQQQRAHQEDLGTIVSLAQVAEVDFWFPVLDNIKGHLKEIKANESSDDAAVSMVSKTLSVVLVAACAYAQHGALTLDKFLNITDASILPAIDVNAAFPLLSVEKTLMDQYEEANAALAPDFLSSDNSVDPNQENDQEEQPNLSQLQQHFVNSLLSLNDTAEANDSTAASGGENQANQSASSKRESWKLTSLQERCVVALTQEWASITYDDKCVELLMSLENPYLISRITVGALSKAKEQSAASSKPRLNLGWPQRSINNQKSSPSLSSSPVPSDSPSDKKFRSWLPKATMSTTTTTTTTTAAASTSSPQAKQRQWLPLKNMQQQQQQQQQSSSPSQTSKGVVGEKLKGMWRNKKTTG